MPHKLTTLEQFIADREHHLGASGEFSQLLRDIALAARIVNREVNRAGLNEILGKTGQANVQGEEVQKLDEFANEHFIRALKLGGTVCAIGSEEEDDIIALESPKGKYVVLMDPLDGSSNIDVNVSIGTIFSIYRRVSNGGAGILADCLQPGAKQIAAGYVLYGSSTMLVYSTGNGVHFFTLDPSLGEFFLSSADVKIPEKAAYLSINDSNFHEFADELKNYLIDVRERNAAKQNALNSRYIGSLVADFHRNLLKGGIFIYPGTVQKPKGKLRLLYECNPMAFIAEQAGGAATDGKRRILDIEPIELHQRAPLFVGSKNEMATVMQFLAQNEAVLA